MSGTSARTSSAAAPVTSVRDAGMLPCAPRTSPCSPRSRSRPSRRCASTEGVPSTAATVMPQIGSTASLGVAAAAGAGAAAAAALLVADGDDPGQDRERHLGRGAGADVEPGGDVDAGQLLVRHAVAAQLCEHAGAAARAGHQADVGHARLQAAPQRVQLVAAVRGDHQRQVARRGSSPSPSAIDVAELGAEPQQRGGDRRVAARRAPAAPAAPARGTPRWRRPRGTGSARSPTRRRP